jgi:hypothetical protein
MEEHSWMRFAEVGLVAQIQVVHNRQMKEEFHAQHPILVQVLEVESACRTRVALVEVLVRKAPVDGLCMAIFGPRGAQLAYTKSAVELRDEAGQEVKCLMVHADCRIVLE